MARKTLTHETLEQMEVQLSHLAMRWRSRKDTPEADTIVAQYQALLRQMIEMGFRSELYTDSELPDRLMPQEYLDLFKEEELPDPSAARGAAFSFLEKNLIHLHYSQPALKISGDTIKIPSLSMKSYSQDDT